MEENEMNSPEKKENELEINSLSNDKEAESEITPDEISMEPNNTDLELSSLDSEDVIEEVAETTEEIYNTVEQELSSLDSEDNIEEVSEAIETATDVPYQELSSPESDNAIEDSLTAAVDEAIQDSELAAVKEEFEKAENLDQLNALKSKLLEIGSSDEVVELLNLVHNKINGLKYLSLTEQKANAKNVKELLSLSNEFAELDDYEDSGQLAKECKERAESLENENKKKIKRIAMYVGGSVVAICFLYVLFTVIIPSNHLKKGEEYLSKQHYEEAVIEFEAAGEYEDASTQLIYSQACLDLKNKDYLKAIEGFEKVKDFEEASKKLTEAYYAQAEIYYKKENYKSAAEAYLKTNNLKDSSDKLYECGKQLILKDDAKAARDAFDGSKHEDAENYLNYAEGLLAIEDENYSKAIEYFDKTHDIAEAAGKKNYCNMAIAEGYLKNDKLIEAIDIYNSLPPETEFNGVTAQTRQNALGQYKDFITTYNGSYTGDGTLLTTQIHKRTGITEGWEGHGTEDGNIHFDVNEDGTLQMIGSFQYAYYYNYSVLSRNLKYSLDTLEVNQTITSIPTQIVDGNATLTFNNGTLSLHYLLNSPNEDQYFTYEYESTYTYTKK